MEFSNPGENGFRRHLKEPEDKLLDGGDVDSLDSLNMLTVTFQRAEITRIRATHCRVPDKVEGWGLTKDAIVIGTCYWIFGPPRKPWEHFYWMHTNVVYEIEQGDCYVQFETASKSIYRVDFLDGEKPSWIHSGLEALMIEFVTRSRGLFNYPQT